MNTNLEKYLHDHLAGAAFAIDLAQALCRKHEQDAQSADLQSLASDIKKDRDELARIASKLGTKPGGLKEAMTRALEKFSSPKLVSSPDDVFSSFEGCEALALGILGKRALWIALSKTLEAGDEFNFKELQERAEIQYQQAERLRLSLAARSFCPPSFNQG